MAYSNSRPWDIFSKNEINYIAPLTSFLMYSNIFLDLSLIRGLIHMFLLEKTCLIGLVLIGHQSICINKIIFPIYKHQHTNTWHMDFTHVFKLVGMKWTNLAMIDPCESHHIVSICKINTTWSPIFSYTLHFFSPQRKNTNPLIKFSNKFFHH